MSDKDSSTAKAQTTRPSLLTRREVAAILRVHPKTVDRYPLPYVRLAGAKRFERTDVEKFIAERKVYRRE